MADESFARLGTLIYHIAIDNPAHMADVPYVRLRVRFSSDCEYTFRILAARLGDVAFVIVVALLIGGVALLISYGR